MKFKSDIKLTLHSVDTAHVTKTHTGHTASCVKIADNSSGIEGNGNTSQNTTQAKAKRGGNAHWKLKTLVNQLSCVFFCFRQGWHAHFIQDMYAEIQY